MSASFRASSFLITLSAGVLCILGFYVIVHWSASAADGLAPLYDSMQSGHWSSSVEKPDASILPADIYSQVAPLMT